MGFQVHFCGGRRGVEYATQDMSLWVKDYFRLIIFKKQWTLKSSENQLKLTFSKRHLYL